jgi:hypothetical protein
MVNALTTGVEMGNISDAQRRANLLAEVPQDGSPVGNTYLSKQLGWTPDVYLKIPNELVAEGKLSLGRGRGGSVRLSEPSGLPTTDIVDEEVHRHRERSLYPTFRESLRIWADAQGWSAYIIEQTSDQGRRRTGGRYTRPDFVVIGVKKYRYTPGVVRDIETFELKPIGAAIESVFEAAAHSRLATKSYLALQVGENEPTEDELSRIEAECQRFRIGLITFEDPKDYASWRYPVDPIRTEPDPELVEQFVRNQLSAKNQDQIGMWMH